MNEKTIKVAEAYKPSKLISSLDALKLAKCNYAIMEETFTIITEQQTHSVYGKTLNRTFITLPYNKQ
uniref:Uncharacterized protein n=1 Tax=Glossina austeni TaxID=7395 RepID=A0A1A9VH83_GLOAU